MADIELKCSHCANVVTASEFVDYATLVCKKCGGRIGKPSTTADDDAMKYRLKAPMAQHGDAPAGQQDTPVAPAPLGAPLLRAEKGSERPASRFHFRHDLAAWALFVVLGTVMGLLRYGDVWKSPALDKVFYCGPYILIGFHALIVLRAFKESMFHGMLCLLVPFYSFYYLFLVTDAFYLRAILSGLLVGIAQDAAQFYQQAISRLVEAVNSYIASGG